VEVECERETGLVPPHSSLILVEVKV
jgi:hypothetical protein